jgi:hypothetical protein
MFVTDGKPTNTPLPYWLAFVWGIFSVGIFGVLIGYGVGTLDWFWRTGISRRPGLLLISSAVFLFFSFFAGISLVRNSCSTHRKGCLMFLVTCTLIFLSTGFAFYAREGTDGAYEDRGQELSLLVQRNSDYANWLNNNVLKNATVPEVVLDEYVGDRTKNPGRIILGTYIVWGLLAIGLFYFVATWESGPDALYSSLN